VVREEEWFWMVGMAHTAMVVQAPSTSYGVAMPRCHRVKVVVKKAVRCGFVGGERASFFAAGEAGLWSSLRAQAGRKRKRRTGGRACVCMAADYYATLGISRSATKSEIKAAYRKLARKVSFSNPGCWVTGQGLEVR
jgi:hypothetical protein